MLHRQQGDKSRNSTCQEEALRNYTHVNSGMARCTMDNTLRSTRLKANIELPCKYISGSHRRHKNSPQVINDHNCAGRTAPIWMPMIYHPQDMRPPYVLLGKLILSICYSMNSEKENNKRNRIAAFLGGFMFTSPKPPTEVSSDGSFVLGFVQR